MIIFPSIDLLNNEAVRLIHGDRNKKTVYGNAIDIAVSHKESGAKRLHIVDLDGAFGNVTVNYDLIKAMRKELNLELQVGGGIKSYEKIQYYLNDLNVNKIVLGTLCVTNIDLVEKAVDEFGANRIVAGIDANGEYIMTQGWNNNSQIFLNDIVERLKNIGIQRYIYTDISRDGTLLGMNLERTSKLQKDFSIEVVASGGLKDINDIKNAKKMGIFGCIIGKAYYNGTINIKDALQLED